ncbi:MAG: hypothetical protein PVF56_07225 [Desulfobacterales bacterium]|jgi:hypothetical protein
MQPDKPKTGLCQSFSIGCLPEKLDPNGKGIIVEYVFTGFWSLAAGFWLTSKGFSVQVSGVSNGQRKLLR